jgi:hypothetical protein
MKGDASGIAEGDVFARVRKTLNLPATRANPWFMVVSREEKPTWWL